MGLWRLQVERAAAGLMALGLKPGDRLAMWGPNTYEWILVQFAAATAGIILVGPTRCSRLKIDSISKVGEEVQFETGLGFFRT